MKTMARTLAMVLILAMAMSIPAFAAEEDPVLFTFNGKDVLQSEVDRLLQGYAQNGYISSDYAYDEAIEYMIVNQLTAEAKAHELGLDEFTEEELAQIKEEAAEYFDAQQEAMIDVYSPEMSEEDRKAFKEELTRYWETIGTTMAAFEETHRFNVIKSRLLETMAVEISDEEISAIYEEQVSKDKEYFADNVLAYEYYTYYLTRNIWYTPEGFRRIHQIMFTVDQELIDAYKAAEEAADEKALEEAKAAILASRQDDVDAVYARLNAGEDFITVMNEVSEDPALNEYLLEEGGYMVHPESNVYGTVFAAAAFGDDMQAVGDISAPAVAKTGIHILYYNADEPAGPVELDDDIRNSITLYLTSQKRSQMLQDWSKEYEVTYNQKTIDKLMEDGEKAAEAAADIQ